MAAFSELGIAINISAGFSGKISFFWSNPFGSTTVRIYSKPDSHGVVLADHTLGATSTNPQADMAVFATFNEAVVPFSGIAESIIIRSRSAGGVFVDDIELTPLAEDPAIPEPATLVTTLAGVTALLVSRFRRGLRRGASVMGT